MATSPFPLPTGFNSSPLVRQLASLGIGPSSKATQTVAEQLGRWVAWTDAIALSRMLADAPAAAAPGPLESDAGEAARRVVAHVARVRNELAEAIAQDAMLLDPGSTGARSGPGAEGTIDYSAYRRQYRAHQHTMEDRIGALRARVRTVVAGASPALGRLAALDAVLDQALAGHQRRLLDKVPQMLEKRLRALHVARPAPVRDAPAPAGAVARRVAVGTTVQRVLLAELETRMQPVQGLIDTLGRKACTPA